MSPNKPMITIDGEWLLAKIELIEYTLDEIRAVCAGGAFVTPDEPSTRMPALMGRHGTLITGAPQAGVVDINGIDWKIKNGASAQFDDPWAWAFAYNEDGSIMGGARDIMTALLHEDKVMVGQYEITLGGRDDKLLSRTIPKAKGRRRR